MEEKLHEWRRLNFGQILVGQACHRALEGLDLARGLQRVLVGLVFDGPAQSVADGHDDQSKDTQ